MYSKKLLKLLKSKNIEIGDEISVTVKGKEHTGILMPRPFGKEDALVLKLSNGYNIGIAEEHLDQIKLVKKSESTKQKAESDDGKRSIGSVAILGCGGTIASKVEYKTGGVYPAISSSELRMAFPALGKLSKIHSKQLFSLFSEDMNIHHWKLLADEIAKEVKNKSDGVVVMHGTDTMTYTSAAMSFMLQNLPIPVIFVGAQRSSDRPSSENEINLLNAVYSAKQNLGEVGVCMHADTNDDYCYLHKGTKVRKMHTSRRDAFRSINSKPLAIVDYSKKRFEHLCEYKKRSGPLKKETKLNDNVAFVYVHPNIKPKFISSLSSYDGVVLLTTGLGQIPTNAFNDKSVTGIYKEVKDLISSDITVVAAPQTISGRLNMKVYTNGRMLIDAGVIGHGMDWSPEAAYVKLCWVLGQTNNPKKARELMETNIAGEITTRTTLDF